MTTTTTQQDRAALLRSLHIPGTPLVLPNAWDGASARLAADAGAAVIATTSAGVAWSLGFGDGGRLDRTDALGAVARIVGAVGVPVTADIEGGYGSTAEDVAETVRGVLAAGAVGVNLEDAPGPGADPLRPVAEQAARITAARQAADAAGVPLFVNARIDTHRLRAAPDIWLKETLARAAAYAHAGADGVFVLGALDRAAVSALVDGVPVPLNVQAEPGTLPVSVLAELGVARISAGSSIAEAAYGLAARGARELLTSGTTTALDGKLAYRALNSLMTGPA
ncbi:isocitrate lyase/phosphoenolpyruvate mutase family protein [Streptomyces sp. NPDC087850]|uniref:isocitrate lyase/PEP mutase family protein n=1 Tax=Streptomyces sp. NPDC087850 TaxID=3365809 RepID=UPI003805799B